LGFVNIKKHKTNTHKTNNLERVHCIPKETTN